MDRSYIKSFSSVLLVVGYANGGRLVKAFGGASKLFFTSSLILILQRLYQWLFSDILFWILKRLVNAHFGRTPPRF